MNKNLAILCLLAPGLFAFSAPAADRVLFPAGNQSWVVDVVYADREPSGNTDSGQVPAAPPRATRVEGTSFDGTQRYRVVWSNGTVSEVWSRKGITLAKDPASGKISLSPNVIIPGLVGNLDGSLFSWVAEAEPGIETVFEKRKTLLYEKPPRTGTPDIYAGAEEWRPRQAWIDPETLLPIAYGNGLATFRFRFQNPPVSPLVMPEDFARLHTRILNSTSQLPSWAGKK